MINVLNILELQSEKITQWHTDLIENQYDSPWNYIEENIKWNFLLWHEEDIARVTHIDPLRIVAAKRNIDRYNQARNNSMEKIDEWILQILTLQQVLPPSIMHSETPGMMIDRLTILQLKKYHMEEEVNRKDADDQHIFKCQGKLEILKEQINDLANCLAKLIIELQAGKLKFKIYRQLKMYNDPTLNPQLYKGHHTK